MNIREMARQRPNRLAALRSMARASRGMWRIDHEDLHLTLEGSIGYPDKAGRSITTMKVEAALAMHPAAERLFISIDSTGGDIKPAFEIYDLLRNHGAYIATIARGVCASAATVLLVAGDFRSADEGTEILIHQGAVNPEGSRRWTAGLHAVAAAQLRKTNAQLIALYTERTGRGSEVFRIEMENEHPLTLYQARKMGLIHCESGHERWHAGRAFYEEAYMRAGQRSLRAEVADAVGMMARAGLPVPVIGL